MPARLVTLAYHQAAFFPASFGAQPSSATPLIVLSDCLEQAPEFAQLVPEAPIVASHYQFAKVEREVEGVERAHGCRMAVAL